MRRIGVIKRLIGAIDDLVTTRQCVCVKGHTCVRKPQRYSRLSSSSTDGYSSESNDGYNHRIYSKHLKPEVSISLIIQLTLNESHCSTLYVLPIGEILI